MSQIWRTNSIVDYAVPVYAAVGHSLAAEKKEVMRYTFNME